MGDIEKLYSSIKNEKIRDALKDFTNAVAEYQCRDSFSTDVMRWSLKKLIDEIQSRKVYIITAGEYDDYRIVGTSSTPETAKEFMDQFPDQKGSDLFNELDEFVIDDLKEIPIGKFPYFARVEKDTLKFLVLERKSLNMSNANSAERDVLKDHYGNFMVYVWASDDDEAYKNVNLKLSEYFKTKQ